MPQQTLQTDKDAYVDEANPDTNTGNSGVLRVRSQGGVLGAGDRRLLCSFDLSLLPANATRLTAATLRLVPTSQSALARTLRCNRITGSWTEAGVTWNNQPAVGADHGTQGSGNNPQDWNVLASVEAVFPDGRAEFRIRDDTEGSADGPQQEYTSSEGAGTEPELVVTFEVQDEADLASTVAPTQFSETADLPSTVTARRSSARFGQLKRVALLDGVGGATTPNGVAYDETRAAVWVADQAAAKVRRHDAHSLALQQEYDVPAGFEPVGCAFDGEFLWLSDDFGGTIRKFSIGATTLTEEASYAHDFRTVIAWDGAAIWSADTIGQEVYRHNLDGTLSVAETFTIGVEVWGLAFPDDADDPYTLENLAPSDPDFRFRRRRASDMALLQTWEYRGRHGDRPFGFTFIGGREAATVITVEETAGDALVWTQGDLATTVQPANIPRTVEIAATVRPGNIPREEALASVVLVRTPGRADLTSLARPRFDGTAVLSSLVAPTLFEVAARGRVTGLVTTPVVVDARDFREISAEVGSTIEWTRAGVTRAVRRVVQLIDTQETHAFPRERTSEVGRGSTQDQLRRGDAVLYALGEDDFRPGDRIAWMGLTWEVVGVLGFEMIGNVKIYAEVGLRRLPVKVAGRATGTVGP